MTAMLSAREAARRIRSGASSAEALVAAALERIGAREPEVGAWTWLDPEAALEAARRADREPARGALHGVPIGVKDIVDTFDMPTGLGFAPYAQRRPSWDASCVAACRRAGAIVLGKTVTTEFAYFAAGKTRNPHDLRATPGGSSSGSAAAVADGMVPLAFGSQTAASLIRPAAFCGVVGYKASHGEFSLSGIRPFAQSLDSLGVLARCVDDIVLMREVLRGVDASPAPATAPRLGFCRTAQWSALDAAAGDAIDAAVDALRRAGIVVDDIEAPPSFALLIDAHRTIMSYEAARNYVFECDRHRDRISAAFAALCDAGWAVTASEYEGAKRKVEAAAEDFRRAFAGYQGWIAPAAVGEAPPASEGTGDPLHCRLWTALGAPCLALPIGRGPRGLPLGWQLVGMPGSDDALLGCGAFIEQILGS